ncbi:hypothetical protein [Pseudolabrys sp. FHR47]|uniref:hypothetical protein n=1 Tax=Pseudolabrys sp. FHR47 TaxID=2562284 RepID=UPI0010BE899D|nr:hypothetical protein [Pseudolabrys sp. FHR47]
MTRRQTVLLALAGAAAAAFVMLADHPAVALTLENYSGAGNGPANGWTDLNYNDPNKKPSKDGDKRTLDTGPRIFFGPSGSANQNFSPSQYFQPNYLMGK